MPHNSTHDMLMTMVAAVSAGIMLITVARRLHVPVIAFLLLGGVALGPEGLGLVKPDSLREALPAFVSLAVALILFEGGLNLELSGYRSAPQLIRRLLSIGVLITWILIAAAIYWMSARSLELSLLAASLVIVTGPTVIGPLLKRIRIQTRLHHILHWEGVLIDPIGVFIALLCFEWISGSHGGGTNMLAQEVLGSFAFRLVCGTGIGILGGLVILRILHTHLIPDEMLNLFAMASAVLVFGIGEAAVSEAGILSAMVAGLVVGIKHTAKLKQIRQFKEEMANLLIGILFILLAARLPVSRFQQFGLQFVLLLGTVILLVRPVSVFVCAMGGDLDWRSKVFLSWVAPRGIVAASMASLFTIRLQKHGMSVSDSEFIEMFTYAVIGITVLLQGCTAGPLASLLKLKRPPPTGWLIVGAHELSRQIGRFIHDEAGQAVLLVDANAKSIVSATEEGFHAIHADARDRARLEEHTDMLGIGNLLALTDNEELNELLCGYWMEVFGREHVFRWTSLPGFHARDGADRGRPVLCHLPAPKLISAELNRGESTMLHAIPGEDHAPDLLRLPIVARKGREIFLDPSPEMLASDGAVESSLCVMREPSYLPRCLYTELCVRMDAGSLDGLFDKLIDLVAGMFPEVRKDRTLDDLLDKERAFPTILGNGFAAPHVVLTVLKKRICVLVQIPEGVAFGADDEVPTRFMFLLLSPKGDPKGHLATLAQIARLLMHPGVRAKLMSDEPATLPALIRQFFIRQYAAP